MEQIPSRNSGRPTCVNYPELFADMAIGEVKGKPETRTGSPHGGGRE
jgi:hypothetical protein